MKTKYSPIHANHIANGANASLSQFFVLWMASLCTCCLPTYALVFHDLNDPAYPVNDNPPSTALENQPGYPFIGGFTDVAGGILATVISPNYAISVRHNGQLEGGHLYIPSLGQTFTIVEEFHAGLLSREDLTVFRLAKADGSPAAIANYAPLYSGNSEPGKIAVVHGNGYTCNNGNVILNSEGGLGGYETTTAYGARWLWGKNMITSISDFDEIQFTFDAPGSGDFVDYECAISFGDSGGPWFLQDGATWKLAGVAWIRSFTIIPPYDASPAYIGETDRAHRISYYYKDVLQPSDWLIASGEIAIAGVARNANGNIQQVVYRKGSNVQITFEGLVGQQYKIEGNFTSVKAAVPSLLRDAAGYDETGAVIYPDGTDYRVTGNWQFIPNLPDYASAGKIALEFDANGTLVVRVIHGNSYTVQLPANGQGKLTCAAYNFQDQQIQSAFQSGVPDGLTVYAWNYANQTWATLSYDELLGGWNSPTYILEKGVTMLIRNPSTSAISLVLSGTASTTAFWYSGFGISPALFSGGARHPLSGPVDLACAAKGFQILSDDLPSGTTVYTWDFALQNWISRSRGASGWLSGSHPSVGPKLRIGEGCFITVPSNTIFLYGPNGSVQTCP